MDLEKMLAAIAAPSRYQIYTALLERKHCTRSLSKKLGMSEAAISQHLKVMREAGLIYGERYGRHMHYLPDQEAIDFMADEFEEMRLKSKELDRDMASCQCEFRAAAK